MEESLGKRIRRAREAKKIGRAELGELVGVSYDTINRWESDKRSPDAESLLRLSRALDVTALWLLGEQQGPYDENSASLGRRIAELRAKKNLSQEQFALAMNCSLESVIRIEKGEQGPLDQTQIRMIANCLGLNEKYLMKPIDDSIEPVDGSHRQNTIPPEGEVVFVPVLSRWTHACNDAKYLTGGQAPEVEDFLPLEAGDLGGPKGPRSPFVIRAQGESMSGVEIHDGDKILVNPNVETKHGDVVFLEWRGTTSVKGLILLPDGGLELRPANAAYPTFRIEHDARGEIEIVGKVINIIRVLPVRGIL